MQIPEIIQESLDYIERNLKTDITAEELARMANYSTFYFYRLFSSAVGMSVSGYILKRRLDHALGEIAGGRTAIEVVLEYGFETYAGFYKAFLKMYGCSPKKYLSIYSDHKPRKLEVADMHTYTEKELRKLLENWDINKAEGTGRDSGPPISDVFLSAGSKVSGNVWSVGGGLLLKTGSREKLLRDIRVAQALTRQGFQAAVPIKTKTGEPYLDGEDLFLLTRAPVGSPLPQTDRFGGNRAGYGAAYGRGIARLHQALKEAQKDITLDEVNLYQTVTEWALPKVRQQSVQWNMGLDEAFFEDYMKGFGRLYSKLPRQLIHRDPNPSNILFENDTVSGFIDFDLSEISIRLWDPCYCATGLLSETGDENYEKWLDVLGGILRGYNSECRLTAEEKEALFYVLCSIAMIFTAYISSQDTLGPLGGITRRIFTFTVRNKTRIMGIL